jgi:hypothetical protein
MMSQVLQCTQFEKLICSFPSIVPFPFDAKLGSYTLAGQKY